MDRPQKPPPEHTLEDSRAPARSNPRASDAAKTTEAQREWLFIDKAHYEFHSEVARGGLGRISKARDRRLNRVVAIKELLRPSPAAEARFLREIEITVRLQHPNIVAIHEAGRWHDGQPFYAMNYVAGQTLVHSIEECRELNDRLNLLSIVLNVAEAVAFAHSEGIVHRDLKPANVLVGPFGETVVIDWGLAKRTSRDDAEESSELDEPLQQSPDSAELTRLGAALGTPPYMPPEQAEGAFTDERSDVYALGAILYHVLSGERPYADVDDASLLDAVRRQRPQPLARLAPSVSPDLVAIVEKAMHPNPDERYPSGKEFAEDLRNFTLGRLVRAYRYGLSEMVARLLRRNIATVVTAGVFSFLLAILLGVSIERILRERAVAATNKDIARTERKRATTKADALIVSEAQAFALTDPTRAAARLKRLRRIPPGAVSAFAQAEEAGIARWVLRGHTDAINCLAAAPRSHWIASGGDDHTVRLWQLGSEATVLQRHTDRVAACAFSPDGRLLASGGYDGHVLLWHLDTLKADELALNATPVKALVFAEDSQMLYAATEGDRLRAYNLPGGEWTEHSAPNERWPSLHATAEGLLTGPHSGKFALWDRQDHWTESPASLGNLRAAAWDPARGHVVLGGATGGLWVWQPGRGTLTSFGNVNAEITAVTFTEPDGAPVAATDSGTLLTSGDSRAQVRLLAHNQRVVALQRSRSGRFLASGGWDKQVLVYDTASRSVRSLLGHSDVVGGLAFTDDEQYLVSSSWDNTLRVWPLNDSTHRNRRVFDGHQIGVHSVRFSPDGSSIVSGGHDNQVRLWNVESGSSHVLQAHTDHVYRVLFSPDGKQLASSGDDQVVHLWRATGEHERTLRGHTADVEELAYAPSGAWLASASEDHTARLWDVATGQSQVLRHGGAVTRVAFSPDGQLLATSSQDGRLRLFRVSSGDQVEVVNERLGELSDVVYSSTGTLAAAAPESNQVLLRGAGEAGVQRFSNLLGARNLAFSPDARLLAVSGARSHLWLCTLSSRDCRELSAPGGAVRSLRFSPDSRSLVTAGSDTNVTIWDVDTAERRVYRGHQAPIFDLDISRDGRFIVTAGGDASVRLWPLAEVLPPNALLAQLSSATTEVVETQDELSDEERAAEE